MIPEICEKCLEAEIREQFNESNGLVRIESWHDKALLCQRLRASSNCIMNQKLEKEKSNIEEKAKPT